MAASNFKHIQCPWGKALVVAPAAATLTGVTAADGFEHRQDGPGSRRNKANTADLDCRGPTQTPQPGGGWPDV